MMHEGNIEELILLFIDNELSPEAAQKLLDFIQCHPEYKLLLESYASVKLQPEEDMAFPGKETLLQKQPEAIPFFRRRHFLQRAAALLLVGAFSALFLLKRHGGRQAPLLTTAVPPLSGPANSLSGKSGILVAAIDKHEKTKEQAPAPLPKRLAARKHARPDAGTVVTGERAITSVKPLPLPQTIPLPRPAAAVTPANISLPEVAFKAEPETGRTRLQFPGWMPIDDRHLEGLNDLIEHVRTVGDKMEADMAVLEKPTFVLHLANRDIIIGRKTEHTDTY